MSYKLRRYEHPGKYEGGLVIDQIAHRMSQDGADEEVSLGGDGYVCWYGLLRGPLADISATEHLDLELTADELAYLSRCAGAIVHEDDQGFVYVDWYTSADKMEKAWQEIEAEAAETEENEEESAEVFYR